MKWDKGNTPIMPRIVPGTMIRILPPWQKTAQKRANPLRPHGPALRVIEADAAAAPESDASGTDTPAPGRKP